MLTTGLIDAVTEILTGAAEIAIVPRFRALGEADITEKEPGEVVTVADREAEELIAPRLRALVDAPVVGEEATAANPALLRALRGASAAWVVDPIDGTANFVAGRPQWAVMAALVRDGQTVAGWIVRPADGRVYVAERGGGAWRNGVRVRREPAASAPVAAAKARTGQRPGGADPDPSATVGELRGAAHTRFLDTADRDRVMAAVPLFAGLGPGSSCAGFDYPQLIDGELDFVLFWRTLPWDHAAGTLLVAEAGGVARRPDGSQYRPDDDRAGLLAAADARTWDDVRPLLLG